MKIVAWQTKGRMSFTHYTKDGKQTLCGKQLPDSAINEFLNVKRCKKCRREQALEQFCLNAFKDKGEHFKAVVEQLGGTYEFEDGEHRAWWDAYDDKKDLYIAYGKLTTMVEENDRLCLLQNWLYFKENAR